MGSDIDKKVLVKLLWNPFKLLFHGVEVDNRTNSYDACRILVEDSGRDDVKSELSIFVHNGVTCVVTTLVSDDDICISCKIVNDPSLSLITPLGAYN